jgi:Ca-activated chloride channel family protein
MQPSIHRPLSLAIALALTLTAGCSAPNATKPTDSTAATTIVDDKNQAAGATVNATAPMSRADSAQKESDESRDALVQEEPAPPPPEVAKSEQGQYEAKASKDLERVEVAGSRMKSAAVGGLMQPLAVIAPAPMSAAMPMQAQGYRQVALTANTENYAKHGDNPVQRTAESPVSTFSIDVDTGSYANVRRMLNEGQRPPADAVRAEELINYFDYAYPMPATRDVPFRVTTEIAAAPWNAKHELLQIGIQGYDVPKAMLPASNLVFLIDTSGSMDEPDKLPLLKRAFALLVPQLRAQDRVSIVVYAGSAGLVLPPTPGDQHARILAALDQLEAGGSTNGGAGIALAYALARHAYIKGGSNRVLLATDGDFNVGTANVEALKTMVGDQRKSGIALSTLGFGQGNYNDEMAEQLADVGDGNYAYIDTLNEGRKVLVQQMGATLLTIAKDVKIQVEFNPATVAEYRLIGYEDRALRREDFNNDKIDAGEIGAGHNVTALYELTLVGSGGEASDPLRYAHSSAGSLSSNELCLLKLRYKRPDENTSRLIQTPLTRSMIAPAPSQRLRFAAAVAAYADLLRGGSHMGGFGWNDVARLAAGTGGVDRFGYRAEFVQLVAKARALTGDTTPAPVASVSK